MRKAFSVLVVAVVVMMAASCNRQPKVNEAEEISRIEQVINSYVKTINDDDTLLVNQIWSHGDEVSFIGPSGRYSTYNEIRDNLVHGTFGVNFTDRQLVKEELSINLIGQDAAWAEFSWSFSATKKDGSPHRTKGRETQIFEKDANGEWKLIHIHYSGRNRN